jgi:hypothetical protein
MNVFEFNPQTLAAEIKHRLVFQPNVFISGTRLKAAFIIKRESFREWSTQHNFGWKYQYADECDGYSFYQPGSETQKLLEG